MPMRTHKEMQMGPEPAYGENRQGQVCEDQAVDAGVAKTWVGVSTFSSL